MRYQENPTANWGPGSKARAIKATSSNYPTSDKRKVADVIGEGEEAEVVETKKSKLVENEEDALNG